MLLAVAVASQALPKAARMGETSGRMKQFATWFTHGVPGGAKLRAAIYQQRTGAGVLAQVDTFFAAQRASGLDCVAELENEELIFPEETSACG
jgi:tRNA-dihydrouridine synthase B